MHLIFFSLRRHDAAGGASVELHGTAPTHTDTTTAQDAEQDGHTVASLIWQLNAALSKERPLDRDGSRTLASHRLELCTNLTSCEIKLPKFSRCAGSTLRALRALRPGEIGRTPSEMAKNRVNISRRNIFSIRTRTRVRVLKEAMVGRKEGLARERIDTRVPVSN